MDKRGQLFATSSIGCSRSNDARVDSRTGKADGSTPQKEDCGELFDVDFDWKASSVDDE
jgi:hypothetical protein